MNRLLWIASVAFLITGSTGCAHQLGGCRPGGACSSGSCSTGSCQSCQSCSSGKCKSGGLLGKLANSGHHAGRPGCPATPLGWQQGGLNYSSHLAPGGGLLQYGAPGHHAAQQMQAQPMNPGPPTGTVAYPYYTHRGPRDFLLDNPPSIGR